MKCARFWLSHRLHGHRWATTVSNNSIRVWRREIRRLRNDGATDLRLYVFDKEFRRRRVPIALAEKNR